MDCIFCKIIDGEIPAGEIFEDKEFLAFRDIHPQAPVHILLVPKLHIPTLSNLKIENDGLMGRLIILATKIASTEHVATKGYRLIVNCGSDGGQVVPHLHLHLLGGRRLDDLMG